MEILAALFGLFIFLTILVIPWVALSKASAALRRCAEISSELNAEIAGLRKESQRTAEALKAGIAAPPKDLAKTHVAPPANSAEPEKTRPAEAPPPIPLTLGDIAKPARPASPATPPAPAQVAAPMPAEAPAAEARPKPAPRETPPPIPHTAPLPSPAPKGEPDAESAKPFNLEQFLGAKLFAWAGGLILFIAAAFGIKYSIEHVHVPAEVRAAFGFLTGLGLIIGGLRLNQEKYAVTRQSLAAAGTLILYAVTFACASEHIWNLLPSGVAFGVMSVITASAFLIAVRLRAPAVAVIGLAGGFLTPPMLSTGDDRPFGLFGYIALLDIGLLAVALRRHWGFLAPLGAAGTLLTQAVWWGRFYSPERYAFTGKIYVAMGVFLAFQALFLIAAHVAKRLGRTNTALTASALALAGSALLAAMPFVGAQFLHAVPAIPFAYAFLVEAGVFALAAADRRVSAAGPVAGGVIFLLLGGWTLDLLTESTLNTGLALYLFFAVVHTATPLVLRRLGKIDRAPGWCQAFPVLALLLALIPAFRFDSLLVWPLMLLLDALAVLLAVTAATLAPVLIMLALTLVAAGASLSHVSGDLSGLNTWLLVLGGVSVGFTALGVWLAKRFAPARAASEAGSDAEAYNASVANALAPASAALPFLLLVMAAARLPLADPSPVYGLALLLSVLLLGLGRLMRLGSLAPVGLAGTALLELVWTGNNLQAGLPPATPLAWNLAFCAVYFAYPFVFHKTFAAGRAPWVASVASLGAHFLLMHATLGKLAPHAHPGLEPALFALPAFAGLALVLRNTPKESPARLAQTALFGGAALAFITAIFPLQFDRQWLTLAWAFEGAALCALFRRVPHSGLRLAGVALLVAAFARLALNPAVLGYHARGDLPVWNWYLYAYALAAVSLFAGARLLAPPRHVVMGSDVTPGLRAMGVTLLFLLLNIEIADFFSAPGARVLTFEFSGNLARDMTYSLGWGLFALTLLVTGILQRMRAARYAAIALLGVTVGKLFLHDLANLDQLYRIGAALGVAVILILAAFLYQMFLGENRK